MVRGAVAKEREKNGIKPQPNLYSRERWLQVKACFDDNCMIEKLKEIAEDRECILGLKFDRLNFLLSKQNLSVEDAFLNDSFCYHFVNLCELFRQQQRIVQRQNEFD